MRRLAIFFAALAAFLIVFLIPAFAVGQPFSVSGQVIDALGKPVSGANVTLIDNNYNVIQDKVTDSQGNYDFVNVVSKTDAVTVRVSLNESGKTYNVPSYYARWYPAQGINFVKSEETQFADYPEPKAGYAYGIILSDRSANPSYVSGDVYLMSLADGTKNQANVNANDASKGFIFHVPAGDYDIYAVHAENGKRSMTTTQRITVKPSWQAIDGSAIVLVIEPGQVPALPLKMLPQIGAPPGTSTQEPGTFVFELMPLLLALLAGLLMLAGLYAVLKKF